MFLSRNKKNNVYPCKPQFYYIKVGLRGSKLYRHVFVMSSLSSLMTNSLSVVTRAFLNALTLRCKAAHFFSAKNINGFFIFQDRNFNVTLAIHFVKF